jgi:hypothetical protein
VEIVPRSWCRLSPAPTPARDLVHETRNRTEALLDRAQWPTARSRRGPPSADAGWTATRAPGTPVPRRLRDVVALHRALQHRFAGRLLGNLLRVEEAPSQVLALQAEVEQSFPKNSQSERWAVSGLPDRSLGLRSSAVSAGPRPGEFRRLTPSRRRGEKEGISPR